MSRGQAAPKSRLPAQSGLSFSPAFLRSRKPVHIRAPGSLLEKALSIDAEAGRGATVAVARRRALPMPLCRSELLGLCGSLPAFGGRRNDGRRRRRAPSGGDAARPVYVPIFPAGRSSRRLSVAAG